MLTESGSFEICRHDIQNVQFVAQAFHKVTVINLTENTKKRSPIHLQTREPILCTYLNLQFMYH